jgi:hypothetical protein
MSEKPQQFHVGLCFHPPHATLPSEGSGIEMAMRLDTALLGMPTALELGRGEVTRLLGTRVLCASDGVRIDLALTAHNEAIARCGARQRLQGLHGVLRPRGWEGFIGHSHSGDLDLAFTVVALCPVGGDGEALIADVFVGQPRSVFDGATTVGGYKRRTFTLDAHTPEGAVEHARTVLAAQNPS